MNNKLIDIHNNLMATLEDLDNEELLEKPDELEKLCKIAHAKSQIAKTMVDVDRLAYDVIKSGNQTLLNTANPLRID